MEEDLSSLGITSVSSETGVNRIPSITGTAYGKSTSNPDVSPYPLVLTTTLYNTSVSSVSNYTCPYAIVQQYTSNDVLKKYFQENISTNYPGTIYVRFSYLTLTPTQSGESTIYIYLFSNNDRMMNNTSIYSSNYHVTVDMQVIISNGVVTDVSLLNSNSQTLGTVILRIPTTSTTLATAKSKFEVYPHTIKSITFG